MDIKPGTFVISLDFELMWGMFDKVTTDSYGENIAGVHQAIPSLLGLFKDRDIHATWATVGMLATQNKTDLLNRLPKESERPNYKNTAYSAYQHLAEQTLGETDQYYFAPELVQKITDTPGQELASHTFSHYYCLEERIESEGGKASFVADCDALTAVLEAYDQAPTSIVFPRNQWNKESLAILKEKGITAYRGTENHFLYRARTEAGQTNLFIRALRLLDHYLNLSGHHTYKIHTINRTDASPLNIPASRFLRPYSKKLRFFESFRLRRIKRSMTHAAKRGEVFHLWWHPHNFGTNLEQNMQNLITLLDHFKHLQNTYGMESKSMQKLTHAYESNA